jgi:uncharacterized SAM-binding protein YcdF (DUF218 family)
MSRQKIEDHASEAPVRRRHPFLRLIVAVSLLYAAGFGLFVINLPAPKATDDARADGIVALTGEGDRLAPAVSLLEMGNAGRLLISGVNKLTSKTELKSLLKGGASFDCCADLGFTAADTRGNAEEAASWVHQHHYRSLIVVTAAYHMPRSLLELGAEMPEVSLVPFPVAAESQGPFTLQTLRRLNGEYAKFLASWVRVSLLSPPGHA